MRPNDPSDVEELLPDFVAECDEHLTAARRTLLEVESSPGSIDAQQIGSLFRNFHSVKGLSGMVGLAEAERLAHEMEAYWGVVRKGQVAPSQSGIALLIEGVRALEEVVAARRDRLPIPAVDGLVARLAGLIHDSVPMATLVDSPAAVANSSGTTSPAESQLEAARRGGAAIWRVRFTPSAALTERGITVNAVREKLKRAGAIVSAEPVVGPGGGISFTFVVASSAADFADAVQNEGTAVEPIDAPKPAEAAEAKRPTPSLASANRVRVDLGRLDDIIRAVGELVVTRAKLDNGLRTAAPHLPGAQRRDLEETSLMLERQLRTLREGVMRVRLVPVRDVFARMRFVVRDLARETGQEIDFRLSGEDTEIDKFVVERLADPLLHLVRNAISHGLEPTAEREKAGKPARGRVDLRAAAAGGAVVIEVEDDGRGIDAEKVFARARKQGLIPTGEATDPALVLDLICTPGFSTRDAADRSSGRGVGMDVALKAIEELGGTLDMVTRLGLGTRFTARLPLTLAIADALIVTVGAETYAAPQASIREVLRVEPKDITALENNELLRHGGSVLPLLRLSDLFGTPRPKSHLSVMVVGEGGAAIALAADEIFGLREIVVRRLADPLVQVIGLAGATELGDGRAVLILDLVSLSRYARTRRRVP